MRGTGFRSVVLTVVFVVVCVVCLGADFWLSYRRLAPAAPNAGHVFDESTQRTEQVYINDWSSAEIDLSDLQWRPNCSIGAAKPPSSRPKQSFLDAVVYELQLSDKALPALEWGITLALQHLFDTITQLADDPYAVYILLPRLPNCSPRCSSAGGLALEELIDLAPVAEELRVYRHSKGLGAVVLSSFASSFPAGAVHLVHWPKRGNSQLKLRLLGAMAPSACVARLLGLMRVVGVKASDRVCLHNRIEEDFRCSFRHAPGYFTASEVAEKLREGVATRAELASPVSLYLAGAYDYDDVVDLMGAAFRPAPVYTKRMLLTGERRGERMPHTNYTCKAQHVTDPRASGGFSNSFLAMVDFFYCAESGVFIGNNHSSWSGMVYVWQAARALRGGPPLVALQVNEMHVSNRLYAFCEPNWSVEFGPPCKYERIN